MELDVQQYASNKLDLNNSHTFNVENSEILWQIAACNSALRNLFKCHDDMRGKNLMIEREEQVLNLINTRKKDCERRRCGGKRNVLEIKF